MAGGDGSYLEPILHVDMDAFFVEVERLRDSKLRGRPVVVGGSGRRGVVASASYEARGYGIRSAMPMSSARRRCASLVVVPPDHDEYGRVSVRLFSVFRSFTPLVEGLSVDEAFLDVAGLRLTYESPLVIAQEIRRTIKDELGLPASVGVAANKFVAKLASASAKPDGIRLIPRSEIRAFVHALPVRSLWGVGQATYALLEGLGIETVGDLAAVPASTLERRLGSAASQHLLSLANGEDSRSVVPDIQAKSISVEETFEVDLTSMSQIETEFVRQSERLCWRMRRAGLVGRTVSIKVRYGDFTTLTRSLTLDRPTDNPHHVREATRVLATRVEWNAPVRLLGVGISRLEETDSPRQLDGQHSEKWDDLAEAVDLIRTRYGVGAIEPARLRSSPDKGGVTSSD